jgi:hypothetical protein
LEKSSGQPSIRYQGWIEYEVQDLASATRILSEKGYRLLVANRTEPWGQTVTRLLSPEGLLTGLTITPWLGVNGVRVRREADVHE